MTKFVVINFDHKEYGQLMTDIEEVEVLLSIPDLKSKFSLGSAQGTLYIDLPTSFFKYLKNTIQGFWGEGKLRDNSLGCVLLNAYKTEIYEQEINEQLQSLKATAQLFHTSTLSIPSITLVPQVEELNYENVLTTFIQLGHKRFVIAEGSHNYYSGVKFILDNVELFKNLKAVVVLENFVLETAQEEMIKCRESKLYSTALRHMSPRVVVSDMHPKIKEVARDGYFRMMEALCKNGITMVAGDNELSQLLPPNDDRLLIGNYVMVNNTENFLKSQFSSDSEPYIFYFTGGMHANRTKGILGVSELANAVVIELNDIYTQKASSITTHPKHSKKFIISRNIGDLTEITDQDYVNEVVAPVTNPIASIVGKFTEQHAQRQEARVVNTFSIK